MMANSHEVPLHMTGPIYVSGGLSHRGLVM